MISVISSQSNRRVSNVLHTLIVGKARGEIFAARNGSCIGTKEKKRFDPTQKLAKIEQYFFIGSTSSRLGSAWGTWIYMFLIYLSFANLANGKQQTNERSKKKMVQIRTENELTREAERAKTKAKTKIKTERNHHIGFFGSIRSLFSTTATAEAAAAATTTTNCDALNKKPIRDETNGGMSAIKKRCLTHLNFQMREICRPQNVHVKQYIESHKRHCSALRTLDAHQHNARSSCHRSVRGEP